MCDIREISCVEESGLDREYNSVIESTKRGIKRIRDDGILNRVDSVEDALRDSLSKAEDFIRKTFCDIREELDKRERELVEKLNTLYKQESPVSAKDSLISEYKEMSEMLKTVSSTSQKPNFVGRLNELFQIKEKKQSIDGKYALLEKSIRHPNVLSVGLDLSYLTNGDFSKWGVVKLVPLDSEEPVAQTAPTVRKTPAEDAYNAMKKSKRYKGTLECTLEAITVEVGRAREVRITVTNTGRNMWNDRWRIYQVGGTPLKHFLPKGFSPRNLNPGYFFEMCLYIKFKPGIHESGEYKFAVIDPDHKEKISPPLVLNFLVTRTTSFPEEKVPEMSPDGALEGHYQFKDSADIEKLLKIPTNVWN